MRSMQHNLGLLHALFVHPLQASFAANNSHYSLLLVVVLWPTIHRK